MAAFYSLFNRMYIIPLNKQETDIERNITVSYTHLDVYKRQVMHRQHFKD